MERYSRKTVRARALVLAGCLGLAAAAAFAAPVKIEAVVKPREQIRLDFADGSKRFVLMLLREGSASGSGPLAGTVAQEFGRHDIVPGVSGEASGYLVFTAAEGDVAYVKWQLRAVFVPGADDKPRLLDNGVWEVVGGTGRFKELRGAGILHIRPVSATDRNYILEGDLGTRM